MQLPLASMFVLVLSFYEGTGSCAVNHDPAMDRHLIERRRSGQRNGKHQETLLPE
jgi:hypothetical protein